MTDFKPTSELCDGPVYTRTVSRLLPRLWGGGVGHGDAVRRAFRLNGLRVLFAAGALSLAACGPASASAEELFNAPVAARTAKEASGLKTAIFAGGCFWGVEAVFSYTKGVKSAVSGYHGGNAATANYQAVSSGVTRHAEVVRVTYDPAVIRYDQLLQIFFSVVADPTLKDRQGPDHGPQYRSALIPMNAEQRAVATAYLNQMRRSGVWSAPIVTEIEPFARFFPAEANHQDFLLRNPNNGYIRRWDMPKVEGLKSMFPSIYSGKFQTG